MRKTELAVEHQKAFHQPALPAPVAPEKDTDDYEDFENDADMMENLWHRGEEASEEELMRAEEDY